MTGNYGANCVCGSSGGGALVTSRKTRTACATPGRASTLTARWPRASTFLPSSVDHEGRKDGRRETLLPKFYTNSERRGKEGERENEFPRSSAPLLRCHKKVRGD